MEEKEGADRMETVKEKTASGQKKWKFGITPKFVAGLAIVGICIMAAVAAAGIQTYKLSIENRYNDTAYQIAKTAEGYFTKEELAYLADLTYRYHRGEADQAELDKAASSERYMQIKALLDKLQKSTQANDIFVFQFDLDELKAYDADKMKAKEWAPICYITDSYHVKEQQLSMGDAGPILPEFIEDAVKAYEDGIRPENHFISEGSFGYNTSAMHPVVKDGKTIAMIGVEIPMTAIASDVKAYLVKIFIAGSLVTLMLLILFALLFTRILVTPVKKVAGAAQQFVTNDNEISEELAKIHTRDEIQLLAESVLKMERDINDYIENLTKVTAERERIGAELNIATQIQADMLPSIFPAFPERKELDIYATMTPAKEVGGDFYDFFMVDDRHLAMVMADVSGKGVPAALFMVIGKTLIKDHTVPSVSLSEVFTEVNQILCESNKEGLFITAFECILDLVTGELVFVNAGHDLPFVRKKNGDYEMYKAKAGFVLAGMENMRYRQGSMMLEPGDKLFLYTDGVPEATAADEEMYGMERLAKVLNDNKDKTPEELLPAIKRDIDAFVGDAPQFDDITMLSLEYRFRMETDLEEAEV